VTSAPARAARRADGLPRVIAHRGASAHRAENTRAAFELAVAQGADMIETDLHRTRDGAIVLAHDAELARLGGKGEIGTATWAEVRALDAGGGEPVPGLDETLDALGARIPWNLEIKKPGHGFYEGIEAAAVAAVSRRGLLEATLFSSFYDPVLERLRAVSDGAARLALLVSRRYPHDAVGRARALGARALHPEAAVTTPALVAEAHAAGLAVYVFTVDERAEMERLLDQGVDGLFTNHPDRMRAVLARRVAAGRSSG
jgi:glycerophosphoryl diester phosphodiesterase